MASSVAAGRAGGRVLRYDAMGDHARKPPAMLSGGGGLISTASDYARFTAMLLGGGQLDRHLGFLRRPADLAALVAGCQPSDEKLAALAPGRLSASFFTSSGSEANETAIMTARMYTGRTDVIALRHGYSGRTQTAMSLTGQAPWRSGGVYRASKAVSGAELIAALPEPLLRLWGRLRMLRNGLLYRRLSGQPGRLQHRGDRVRHVVQQMDRLPADLGGLLLRLELFFGLRTVLDLLRHGVFSPPVSSPPALAAPALSAGGFPSSGAGATAVPVMTSR